MTYSFRKSVINGDGCSLSFLRLKFRLLSLAVHFHRLENIEIKLDQSQLGKTSKLNYFGTVIKKGLESYVLLDHARSLNQII